MKPLHDLTPFWNWLPAFRVVAETEHLPTAAAQMHLTPSALSRTIRLLEEAIGEPLFERKGRRLVLLPSGRHLLEAVQVAMRTVHESVISVQKLQYRGPLRIHTPAPLSAPLILPALRRLLEEQPMIEPVLHAYPLGAVVDALRQGDLDLAVVDDPIPDEGIETTLMAHMPHHVYCAPTHPLAACASDTLEAALREASFVAPVTTPSGDTPDAWPQALPRKVTLRVSRMYVAIEAVQSGDYVAILPDIVATRHGLTRLDYPRGASTALFMLHRPHLESTRPGRVELLVRHLRVIVAALLEAGDHKELEE